MSMTQPDVQFCVNFHGLTWVKSLAIPLYINRKLNQAKTPEEIEQIIGEHEPELAQLLNPLDEFLVCDSAAELMADVLQAKGIKCRVVCGISDYGDSHSYVVVDGARYDPTCQGFGDKLIRPKPFLRNAMLVKKLMLRLYHLYGCSKAAYAIEWRLGYRIFKHEIRN